MALRARRLHRWICHLREAPKILLCETLWHTLCNSVTDGFLIDCFLLDCFAAVRTRNGMVPRQAQGSTVKP